MSDMNHLKADLLQDPEFKEYYFEMQPAADLSKALIGARMERGLTQSNLAAITGISQADISRLEACEGNPSLKTLNRIAKGLNMRLKIEFIPADEGL